MNRNGILIWAVLGVLSAAISPRAGAGENSDVTLIAHDTPLESLQLGFHDQKRVGEFLKSVPPDHKMEVECQTIAPGGEAVRHIIRLTTVNAAGKPDGREVNYVDWYRRTSREAEYKNGVLDGVEKQFAVDGGFLVSETPWTKGKIHGVKRTFHPNGKLSNESTYEYGEIKGESRSYSPEGGLIRVVQFAGGARHGDSVDYWPEKPDAVQRVIPYRQGKVHGVAKAFYLNGKIKWERPFQDNRQHGIEKHYSADGAVEKTIYWLEGNEVSPDEYSKHAKK